MRSPIVVGAVVAFCAGSAANAALNFSTDEGAFAAASNASDTYAAYTTAGGPDVPIPLAGGAVTLGDFIYTPIGSEAGLGELEVRAASSTETDAENSLFGFLDGDPDKFSFSIQAVGGPMNAIGFDFTSAASLGGTIVSFDTGDSFSVGTVMGGSGTGFLGITSDSPFSEVTFEVENLASFEGIFIETIYADVVPAPASVIPLAGLAAFARRRRR